VESVDQPTNLTDAALARVRGVDGVVQATPMAIAAADARLANGRFQAFQVIGVDDATLAGAPPTPGLAAGAWRLPDRVVVAAGGSEGKLGTPADARDRWPHDGPHLQAPLRDLDAGDELLVNEHLERVLTRAEAMPRFPPRPLLYATYGNVLRMLPNGGGSPSCWCAPRRTLVPRPSRRGSPRAPDCAPAVPTTSARTPCAGFWSTPRTSATSPPC
jgi:putative ABC transport system permease protein